MASVLRLLVLAALWGSSFLFMRIAAPPLGPAVLIDARVILAALTLLLLALLLRKPVSLLTHKKHFLILGLFNTALPFMLIAYAAQTLNASTLSILNSTAPIWGALIGAIWARTPLTKSVMLGLILGVLGVIVLVGKEASLVGSDAIIPMICSVLASFSYGIATNYAKVAPKVDSFNNAHGSMWGSVVIMTPLALLFPAREAMTFDITAAVIILGIFCTGVAYILYFRLISDIGPSSALSVTFLIPVFGILWGHVFLDEPVGWNTLMGTVLVVAGTMQVTGFSLRQAMAGIARNKAS